METKHFNTTMASNLYTVLFSNREAMDDITATTYSHFHLPNSSKREFFSKGRNAYKMITEGTDDTILFEPPSLIVHR